METVQFILKLYLPFSRTVDGFAQSMEHLEDRGLDSEESRPPPPEAAESGSPVRQAPGPRPSSETRTPPRSASTPPDVSRVEVTLPSSLHANLNGFGVFNNFLFRQDPATGHLSLVPVQVRAPDSVPGLDINPFMVSQSLQGLIAVPENADGLSVSCRDASTRSETQARNPPSSRTGCGSVVTDEPSEQVLPGDDDGWRNAGRQKGRVSGRVHPALQEVMDLLTGQFSLQYLDNGHEDVAMGMCL